MQTDDVCEKYACEKVKVTVRLLDDDKNYILIEGKAKALEFLGNFILAHAKDPCCGRHLGPKTAGNIFFDKDSTKGIYLHRLPCEHSSNRRRAVKKKMKVKCGWKNEER